MLLSILRTVSVADAPLSLKSMLEPEILFVITAELLSIAIDSDKSPPILTPALFLTLNP